ncbi:hypothetical protein EV383_6210 [Pseudonocardia sediminis]|uniref:Uncharacterized protein n=1 Tax=Pseudonocardia sediminis TaxID=1397368 RepID=A0A4Q7U9N9_PSEST|nr:hypothetical protein [Pseudonocardia sediminis]RZT75470.1 hypothetical protein EV383_6210 [Pseudonocardia sediminis]
MGFLQRRRAPAPSPRPPGGAPASGEGPGITRITWQPEERSGWARLPERPVHLLHLAGWCRDPALAAWAHDPITRRSPGGQHWQDIDAWWIDTGSLLSIRARRRLVPDGTTTDGRPRLRAGSSPWTVQLAAHQLTGPAPTVQRWSRPPQTGEGLATGLDIRTTTAAIGLLPQAVQHVVGRPTGQGAIRTSPPTGGYSDQVYAHRRSDSELIAVAAIRQAGAFPDPDAAIDAADWHVTTYRARIDPPARHTLGPG